MSRTLNHAAPVILAILLALGAAACNTRARAADEGAFALAEVPRDTPPTGPAKPSGKGFKVSVGANLLLSLGPGGPINSEQMFADIVTAGRPAKGMPPFKETLTQDQIKVIYAYVKGRAEMRIPPGRPARPA